MADELLTALLPGDDLRLVVALTTETCRHVRTLAELQRGSATALAQGLTAGVLLAALLKDQSRLNVQLECDGPLRGMFVDANAQAEVRGYVKNPNLDFDAVRPMLGNSGFLSVLRELPDGDTYRSSVELQRFELQGDLEAYFAGSDQLRTHVLLAALPNGAEPLGTVGGLLLQPLPNGDLEAWSRHGARLKAPGAFEQALATFARSGAEACLKELFPEARVQPMARRPVTFRCTCSKERVETALLAMGREELEDLIKKDGRAEITCQFCSTRFVVLGDELRALYGSLGAR